MLRAADMSNRLICFLRPGLAPDWLGAGALAAHAKAETVLFGPSPVAEYTGGEMASKTRPDPL